MSLATQVLKYSSKRAVELWNLLKQTKDESDIEILTTSFLQHKSDQEVAIDAVAEVAEQIEAEISAISLSEALRGQPKAGAARSQLESNILLTFIIEPSSDLKAKKKPSIKPSSNYTK